jgi:hypothetical protein
MSFSDVDDHLVEAEITRDEIIGGHRVVLSPVEEPHATQHAQLNYVLGAHVAPGYRAASGLLTRYDEESDFATSTCVFKAGADPATGGRYLEEIAFEVVSEKNERWVTEKALRMHRRGVRRIFTVWVIGPRRVCEWYPGSQSWRPLGAGARIKDPCLVTPLAVAALFDDIEADNAVINALAAKGNPEIRRREAAVAARGRAEAILIVLEARGIAVSGADRQEILDCQDLDRLDRWLRRAVVASSAGEVASEL